MPVSGEWKMTIERVLRGGEQDFYFFYNLQNSLNHVYICMMLVQIITK